MSYGWVLLRLLGSLAGVGLVTFIGYSLIPVNVTTIGFAYLLLVLIIASVWGFFEASLASVAATLTFNFFFLPPIGEFTIADPQNWVALFSFLTTALIASRLSGEVKRRALDAVVRQNDLERLYTFSRAILLIDNAEPFPKQLVRTLADIFDLSSVVLYERRTEQFYRAGPADFDGMDDQLRGAALQGTSFTDAGHNRVITAVRLGSGPIAGLALQGAQMPDSVLQGVANLVAIGLERAKAQDLASQIETAKQGEKFRMTLLDAMAHEFKTPLTSVMAATTSLLANPDQVPETRMELVKIADEEARHLKDLIDDALDAGRLDTANIPIRPESSNINDIVQEVIAAMRGAIDDRPLEFIRDDKAPPIAVDRRLVRLAIKQLLDNALKYSSPDTPIGIHVQNNNGLITIAISNQGEAIPPQEQGRVFDRLYRSPSVEQKIPGSGLGLSIAQNVARAHQGDLVVTSHPGETTFSLILPLEKKGRQS